MTTARTGSPGEASVRPAAAASVLGAVILITHGFGNSLVPALLPRIGESFEAGYGVLGLAVATGLFSYGVGAALGIAIVERVPPRALLILCLGVCAAGFLAVSTAGSPTMLAASVVVIGLASPISWLVTVHIVGQVVRQRSLGRVMAIAAAGAGVGNGINGVFVQTLAGPGQWRWAFVAAAGLSACLIAVTRLVFRHPIEAPSRLRRGEHGRGAWRRIWSVPAGRIVILASMMAGAGGFTFATYLSEVALDELVVSSLAAAVPWWLAATVGVTVALLSGSMSDRGSPVAALAVMVFIYAASLGALAATWAYPTLLIAAFGFAVFNFPAWGLLGLAAHRGLPSGLAVRAVSGGLVVAACAAVSGVAVAGMWIDRAGSLRMVVVVLAVLMAAASLWLGAEYRAEVRPRLPEDRTIGTVRPGNVEGSP